MMLKKIKKTQKLLDDDNEDNQKQIHIPQIEKNIKKKVGVNVSQLAKEKQSDQPEKAKIFLDQDEARGLTSINYIKQRTEKPDKLMEKYIKDKIKQQIPLAFNGQDIFEQDEQQKDAELLEAIRDQQQRFLSNKEEKDPSFYVGGIVEVNLSLEEEARKMAQMEDLKRGQYLKTLIQGKPKRPQLVIIHPDEDEDKEDKAYKDLKQRFYQKGRIYKYEQMKKQETNANFESELIDQFKK